MAIVEARLELTGAEDSYEENRNIEYDAPSHEELRMFNIRTMTSRYDYDL